MLLHLSILAIGFYRYMFLTYHCPIRRLSALNKAYAAGKATSEAERALDQYRHAEKEEYEGEIPFFINKQTELHCDK